MNDVTETSTSMSHLVKALKTISGQYLADTRELEETGASQQRWRRRGEDTPSSVLALESTFHEWLRGSISSRAVAYVVKSSAGQPSRRYTLIPYVMLLRQDDEELVFQDKANKKSSRVLSAEIRDVIMPPPKRLWSKPSTGYASAGSSLHGGLTYCGAHTKSSSTRSTTGTAPSGHAKSRRIPTPSGARVPATIASCSASFSRRL